MINAFPVKETEVGAQETFEIATPPQAQVVSSLDSASREMADPPDLLRTPPPPLSGMTIPAPPVTAPLDLLPPTSYPATASSVEVAPALAAHAAETHFNQTLSTRGGSDQDPSGSTSRPTTPKKDSPVSAGQDRDTPEKSASAMEPLHTAKIQPTGSLDGSDPADGSARLLNSARLDGLDSSVQILKSANGFQAAQTAGSGPFDSSVARNMLNNPIEGAWSKRLFMAGQTTQPNTQIASEVVLPETLDAWPSITEGVNASSNREASGKNSIIHQATEPPSTPATSKKSRARFPWAAKMNPATRNLYRATEPTILEDGTPQVTIPPHVFQDGLENQKEYIIGQFYRCSAPSGGLTHAVVNRIWGRNCRIFAKRLSESTFLFHIPNAATRSWVIQRGLWHIDDCLMFVAPWTPTSTLEIPEISTIPVWVTLTNIPASLYSIKALNWILSGVGEPMLSYKPRLDPTEMGKAKVMVEVELSKPFPQKVSATDEMGNSSLIDVEYAWIPSKCKGCGQLGHKLSRCLNRTSHEDNIPTKTAQTIEKKVPNVPVTFVPKTSSASTSAEISPPEATTPRQTAIQSDTPTGKNDKVSIREDPGSIDNIIKALPKNQDTQESVDAQHETSSKAKQVEKQVSIENRGDTTTEIAQDEPVGNDREYSSSEDSVDENKVLEDTLLRKSTRDKKPTQKAKEMQRSGNKGRRGKGRKGRGYR